MEDTIYIQLRPRVQAVWGETLKLGDVAQIYAADPKQQARLLQIRIVVPGKQNEKKRFAVLDGLDAIRLIQSAGPFKSVRLVGPSETVIKYQMKKRKFSLLFFVLVWLLLFIGSGLTIMNFHQETGMLEMHRKLYWMITGVKSEHPYIIQIPYSIGLGLGMIIFFNHVFTKRINEEPSPLEIELFNYQQNLDQYIATIEPKESTKRIGDD